ncbi:MAG: alpha-amylase family glycosyl hydrolase [Akkermansiaceae bacterium]
MIWSRWFKSCLLAAVSISVGQAERVSIYQVMPRHFGNENSTRKVDGTMAENGCGKFSSFNAKALSEIKALGFTHIWLTGVIEQASGTDYLGRAADVKDLLKGKAGSPYAILDYFDVCPDYAVDPAKRLPEFKALLMRCRSAELKVIIDLVPNHVARSYHSDVKPELSFGEGDQKDEFFHRDNNFFYLDGDGPLTLPSGNVYEPEREHGRVTGNNSIAWQPSINDWYETVKLNYGHDFTTGRDTSHLENLADEEVPDTWKKMDSIIAHWQSLGVDGFRVDMAHMVPMPFWKWSLAKARTRDKGAFFAAEAYDTDPAKLVDGNVLDALLENGFDAVYDDQTYDLLMDIYDGPKWANDIDALLHGGRLHQSLRYAENHDEVRLASPKTWGGLGMDVGRPVTGLLFALGRGPSMIYSGQEVGEPAAGPEGFGGDDARTTIFDYWSMPTLNQWTNDGAYDGGKLSAEQKALRSWYRDLLKVTSRPAFANGEFYGLNHANQENPAFGRLDGETNSGHWTYAFLRSEQKEGGQTVLVVVNLHPTETFEEITVVIPDDARKWAKLPEKIRLESLLGNSIGEADSNQVRFNSLPALTIQFVELIE